MLNSIDCEPFGYIEYTPTPKNLNQHIQQSIVSDLVNSDDILNNVFSYMVFEKPHAVKNVITSDYY